MFYRKKVRKTSFKIKYIVLCSLLFYVVVSNFSVSTTVFYKDPKTKTVSFSDIEPAMNYMETSNLITKGRILSIGQSGEDVYQLNFALRALGFPVKHISYLFTQETQKNVFQFQKQYGLKPDGIAGQETIDRLNEMLDIMEVSIPISKLKIKKYPTKGYWIIINKTTNTLILMRGKEPVKQYPIATGKERKDTPEGKFKIASKVINPQWFHIKGGVPENPLGYRWLGLNIQGGIIYGIHGTNRPASIGRYVSKGCIRMQNKDVEELFDMIPKGIPVWIGTKNQLQHWGIMTS